MDVGMEMAELPEQGALGLSVARVKFAQLGIKKIVEEKRAVLGAVCGRDFRIQHPAPVQPAPSNLHAAYRPACNATAAR